MIVLIFTPTWNTQLLHILAKIWYNLVSLLVTCFTFEGYSGKLKVISHCGCICISQWMMKLSTFLFAYWPFEDTLLWSTFSYSLSFLIVLSVIFLHTYWSSFYFMHTGILVFCWLFNIDHFAMTVNFIESFQRTTFWICLF